MDHLSLNDPSTVIRMSRKARRELNVLMTSKQYEFENMIEKGVIAMLSEQVEHRSLSSERNMYSSFVSNRHEKHKKKREEAANTVKDATGSAGVLGAGSKVVISGVASATSTIQDAVEEKRLEDEAKQVLQSAQILHYINISPTQYGAVAKGVAKILSNRFQLTLLRLAPGEVGYMKFAATLVEFMNANIVKRLRENPSDIVRAFVDAAVPSSTDTFSYRTYLSGVHKQLQIDEEVEEILGECGPAVRSLVGALKYGIDPKTGKMKRHSSYTILGVMAHAFIITGEGGVVQGLGTPHRKDEMLDGHNKYPAILLNSNENVSDLGFNFGTKVTGRALKNAHVVALKRLIPDFFERKAVYSINPVNSMRQLKVDMRATADLVFPEERDECPWTKTREKAWKDRTQKIHEAGLSFLGKERDEEDIITRRHAGRLTAMEFASDAFDTSEAKKDVMKMTDEVIKVQRDVRKTGFATDARSDKQLQAVESARYAALVTSELMTCVIKCRASDEHYLTLAASILEASESAIDVTRGLPIDEARAYRKVSVALNRASENARISLDLHIFCQESFHVLLELVQNLKGHNLKGHILADYIKREMQEEQSKKMKKFRLNIKEHREKALDTLTMAQYFLDDDVFEVETAKKAYQEALQEVQTLLDNTGQRPDTTLLIKIIKGCEREIKKNRDDMRLVLKDDYLFTNDNCDWMDPPIVEGATNLEINTAVLKALEDLNEEVEEALKEANRIIGEGHWWQWQETLSTDVMVQKDRAVTAKNRSVSLLKSVKINPVEGVKADIVRNAGDFFDRAVDLTELGRLRFVLGQEESASLKENLSLPLEEALDTLNFKARSLSQAMKRSDLEEAKTAYEKVKEDADKLQVESLFSVALKQMREVRIDRDKLEEKIIADIERLDYLEKKAGIEIQDLIDAKQGIEAIKEKLEHFNERCVSMDNSADGNTREEDAADYTAREGGLGFMGSADDVLGHLEAVEKILYGMNFTTEIADRKEETISSEQSTSSSETQESQANDYTAREVDSDFVIVALTHILKKCKRYNSDLGRQVETKIASTLSDLKQKARSAVIKSTQSDLKQKARSAVQDGSEESNGLLDNWGIYLVTTAITSVMQYVHDMEDGIIHQEKEATKALITIQSITSQKSPELRSAIGNAMVCIKNAYKDIAFVREKFLRNSSDHYQSKWSLVPNMLEWAGRFWLSEHRSVQAEKARKVCKKSDEMEFGISPIINHYLFFMYYAYNALREQKKVVEHLNKFDRSLRRYEKKLFDFQDDCEYDGRRQPYCLAQLKKEHQWFVSLVSEKLHRAVNEAEKLDVFHKKIFALQTAVYFSVLKERCYKPKQQSERHKALRAAREKVQRQIEDGEHHTTETTSLEKEKEHMSGLMHVKSMDHVKWRSGNTEEIKFEMEVKNLTLDNIDGKLRVLGKKFQEMLYDYNSKRSQDLKRQDSSYGMFKDRGQGLSSETLCSPGKESAGTPKKLVKKDSTTLKFIGGSNRFAVLSDEYEDEYFKPSL